MAQESGGIPTIGWIVLLGVAFLVGAAVSAWFYFGTDILLTYMQAGLSSCL